MFNAHIGKNYPDSITLCRCRCRLLAAALASIEAKSGDLDTCLRDVLLVDAALTTSFVKLGIAADLLSVS